MTSMATGCRAADDPIVLTVARAYTRLTTGQAACWLAIAGGREQRIEIRTIDDVAIGLYGMAIRGATVEVDSATVYTTPFACGAPFAPLVRPDCPTPP
jgi:hypothetical protein